jgi:hypothetical protein
MAYLALLLAAVLVAVRFLVQRDKLRIRQKTRAGCDGRVEAPAAGPGQTGDKRNYLRKIGPFKDVTVYDPVTQETAKALLYDASSGGVGLLAEHLLPRGRELTLGIEGQQVKMLVRSCALKNNRWVIGCEFTEPAPEPIAQFLGHSPPNGSSVVTERR